MNSPEHLDPTAISKWQEIAPTLDVTHPGTADALAAYCVAYSRWTQAEAQVATLGLIVKSPVGFPTENPYLGVVKRALIEMHRWGDVLGLHHRPSRRKAEQDDEGDQGGLLRLLGGTSTKGNKTKAG
jgi:P27 family predicted phage terminase small subunit